MLTRNFKIFCFIVLSMSQALAFGDKTINVKPLVHDASGIENTADAMPFFTDFIQISNNISSVAYHDNESIYLAFSTENKMLMRSLKEVGLRLKFKGNKNQEFEIRLQSAEGQFNFRQPVRIASGIEPLLPKQVNNQLREFLPPSEYTAYLVPASRRKGGQLVIPEFDALYQDSSSTLVLRIPLGNPVYPASILPFDKKGKLKVEVEIGEEFFTRGFISGPGDFYSGRSRNQASAGLKNNDEEPLPFGYEKFDIELLFENWPEVSKNNKIQKAEFNLNAYLELLDTWSAESRFNRGGGFGGGRAGQGGAPGIPPISVQALFAGEPVVKAGIAYVSTFLSLSEAEREQIFQDFSVQWETDSYFPVLVTLRTNLHKSYLDLSRWTIFLEDEDQNQYESIKVVDVTDIGARAANKDDDADNKIQRPIFSSRMKKLVMLFPKQGRGGHSIWQVANRKITFVVLSNEHFEQRLEAEWRVPNI